MLRELFLGCLVIKGSLILKPRLIVQGSMACLGLLDASLGSEMGLASPQPFNLLGNRPTGASTKMRPHARIVLFGRRRTLEEKSSLDHPEIPSSKEGRIVLNLFQSGEFLCIM